MIRVDLREKRVFIALHLVLILPIMTCTILNRGKIELKMDQKGLGLKMGKKAPKQCFSTPLSNYSDIYQMSAIYWEKNSDI